MTIYAEPRNEDASDLGFKPGQWPLQFTPEDGDGMAWSLVSLKQRKTTPTDDTVIYAVYVHPEGHVMHVWND